MNDNQIGSLVLSGLKIAATALAAHGYMASSSFLGVPAVGQEIAGFVVALLAVVASHMHHGQTDAPANPPANAPAGKNSLLVLLAACGLASVMFTGCASGPAAGYKTVSTVDLTVRSAATAWNDYLVANPQTPLSQRQAVRAAFEKVRTCEVFAMDADEAWAIYASTNSGPGNYQASSQAAAATVTDALADLIALLGTFGVKL